ncbi:hypothetical protein AB4520_05255 [Vibrio renipiscarius]|uniref:hypothetical protein n=1 Tax=Vibrio renipiscarius TaxID=1461322 RepID=UPI00355448B8
MNKKLSTLAVSIALILSGCGSDDSNSSTTTPPTTPPPTTATPITGKFIDSAVEGMYYTTTSGKSGLTGSEGEYNAMSDDTITFYIGGENGLKVGAGSARDVLTPFEAAGKYERAVNLAILLQSLDSVRNDNVLTIPDELRKPSLETLKAMAALSLDDRESVITFLKAINDDDTRIVSEADAIEHMNESFGEMVRGGEGANPLMKAGTFVRQIQVTQNATEESTTNTFIHADTMMDKDLYNRTRGMSEMTLRIDNAEQITVMPGSIDSGISGDKAALYLTCLDAGAEWIEDTKVCSNPSIIQADDAFLLGNGYAYRLRDISKKTTVEEKHPAEVFMPFRAKELVELNHYTADEVRNDQAPNETEARWKRETMSGSYDPVTGIYTEIMKDTELAIGEDKIACDTKDNTCSDVRTSEKVFYSYSVDAVDKERYIDFTGEWVTKAICDNGEIAIMTTTFDNVGQTTAGQECKGLPSAPGDLGDDGLFPYTSYSDMWWFGQTERESKATLTELNTLVRYCDADDYQQGEACVDTTDSGYEYNPIYYVKWEYQPAGKNWDQGLLIRTKTNSNGEVEDFSIMQKVK